MNGRTRQRILSPILFLALSGLFSRCEEKGVAPVLVDVYEGGAVDTLMVLIPAGEFVRGSEDGKPVRTIFLDDYLIDKFEVTNAQYAEFMKATRHRPPAFWNDDRFNGPNQPVVGVRWFEAKMYCEWCGKRLPTEAE